MSIPCKMRPVGLQSLPLGYMRLEWLEALGNRIAALSSYIMLPVDINLQTDSFAFETEHELVRHTENQAEVLNTHDPMLFYGMRTNSNAYYGFGFSYATSVVEGSSVESGYNVFRAEYDKGTARFLRNGFLDAQIQKDTPQSEVIISKIGVFCALGVSVISTPDAGNAYPFNGRKKYFKVWVNDELKRHLIPALDLAGIPCMFDLVSKTPFYNQGTGQFIAGLTTKQALSLANLPTTADGTLTVSLPWEAEWDARVQNALDKAAAKGWIITVQYRDPEVATANIPISFLESTGTQYIDTLITLDDSVDVSLNALILDGSYLGSDSFRHGREGSLGGNFQNTAAAITFPWNDLDEQYLNLRFGPNSKNGGKSISYATKGYRHTFRNNKIGYFIDGDLQHAWPESTWSTSNTFFYMAPGPDFSTNFAVRSAKWFSLLIKKSNAELLQFVPILSPTGTPCMYDSVSRQNFYNAGAGAFIAGFDAAEQARKLAYLPDVTAETDETKKSLTVSIPLEVVLDPSVQSALDVAAARGWTIITQYRED